MPTGRVAAYLAACTGAGVIVGRAFGAFARAPFHYPLRLEDVAPAHRALVTALDVVEWPALFGLTLACALSLWAWLEPARAASPRRPVARGRALFVAASAAIGAAVAGSASASAGRAIAVAVGGALGALTAAMVLTLRRAAAAGGGATGARWLRQALLAAGHFATTAAAALSLGYRGESALVHGLVLLAGAGLFFAELAVALLLAILASRRQRVATVRSRNCGDGRMEALREGDC
jgi:hypothetical protein